MILNMICFSNQYEYHPIHSLWLDTRRLYNTMHYDNKNTTEYLVRFCSAHEVNLACNGSLTQRGVQENVKNILFPFHNTGFYFLQEDDKEEADKAGEEIICVILYIENSDKARFSDLKSVLKMTMQRNRQNTQGRWPQWKFYY